MKCRISTKTAFRIVVIALILGYFYIGFWFAYYVGFGDN